jgi:hypothetical protein
MKSTEKFKETIKKYLDDRAEIDELFEKNYKKEGKNIDDCIKYILNTVQKSGVNGFEDSEIYSMAIHYYDEDNIDPGKDIDTRVVVNHKVELTDEEKAEARGKAIRELINENKSSMKRSGKKKEETYKTVDKVIKTDKGDDITIKERVKEEPKYKEQTLF